MTPHNESESRCEPESVLPSQFFAGRRHKEAEDGVRRLLLAVLTDAVRCYQVGLDAQMASVRKRAFREAEQWSFNPRIDGPFSFENVCGALDISPRYLRDTLRRWRAKRLCGTGVTVIRRSSVILVKRMTPAGRAKGGAAS